MTAVDLIPVIPPAILIAGAALLFALATRSGATPLVPLLAAGLACAAAAAAALAGVGDDAFSGAIRRDGAAVFFTALVATTAAVSFLLDERGPASARDVPWRLLSAAGATLLVCGADLLVLLAGAALAFVPLAVAAPGRRVERLAPLVVPALVAFATLDLAVALGATSVGSLARLDSSLGGIGVALLLAALVAAAGLAPLHHVIGGVDGARSIAHVAYASVPLRVAALVALLRVGAALTTGDGGMADWRASIAAFAAVTIVVGALAAVGQSSLRRLLVFSATAQVGFIAMALAAGVAAGPALAFCAVTYSALMLGAFAVLTSVRDVGIAELRGFGRRSPLRAAALAVVLAALAGAPPAAGYLSRLYALELAVGAQLAWLAILGALATALLLLVHLRVVHALLGEGGSAWPIPTRGALVMLLAAAFALITGVLPAPLLEAAQNVRF